MYLCTYACNFRRKQFQEILLELDLCELLELKMQGHLINLKASDYLLSQNIFKNARWSDTLVRFWFKLKHNVLPCNYTLSKWCESVSQVCSPGGYDIESMSRVLNSCKQFRNNYSKRHDKLVDKVDQELKSYWAEVYNNKPVYTSFHQLDGNLILRRLKPDLILMTNKCVVIIDVACPYDLYMDESVVAKVAKYEALKDAVDQC